jgi:hypothetical protein
MPLFRLMLRVGGYMNFAIGLAHVALFLAMLLAMDLLNAVMGTLGAHVSPPAGGLWGWVKLLLMVVAVAGFVSTLGLYGLSGAQRVRRLPLLRTGLAGTATLYMGLVVFHAPEVVANIGAMVASGRLRPLEILVPLWALTIGLSYSLGTIGLWRALAPDRDGRSTAGRA